MKNSKNKIKVCANCKKENTMFRTKNVFFDFLEGPVRFEQGFIEECRCCGYRQVPTADGNVFRFQEFRKKMNGYRMVSEWN